MSVVTMKQFMQRAHELVRDRWMQSQLWVVDNDDFESDDEAVALTPKFRRHITSVCSIGAMRLAFAELVGVEIHEEETGDTWEDGTPVIREWVDEKQLLTHPFYQDGMRILGKAFYEAEQMATYRHHLDNDEKLLNGLDGRPYTIPDVEQSVIHLNDFDSADTNGLHNALVAAFELAVERAPEDMTTEAFGDRVVEPA